MHNGSGTPLTPEQRRALDDLRDATKTLERALTYRDRMQKQAEAVDAPVELILQAAGIV